MIHGYIDGRVTNILVDTGSAVMLVCMDGWMLNREVQFNWRYRFHRKIGTAIFPNTFKTLIAFVDLKIDFPNSLKNKIDFSK